MKKIILMFFLLFPIILQAQVKYLGIVEIDTVIYQYENIFDDLESFLERHQIEKTKDGNRFLYLPMKKVYKKAKRHAMIIEGYFVMFTHDDENDVVTIDLPETWIIAYDLKNKKKDKEKKYDNDNLDSTKPKDLEKKIKDKLKKPKK